MRHWISVPVSLYTAVGDHTVHFHQLQRGSADRVRNRRVHEGTGKEVPAEEIVKGFEVAEGEFVLVEPDELDEIAPGHSQTIGISDFVDLRDIEPVYFDRTYYVAPHGKEYTKVYKLLRAALAEAGKVGIATFVMRGKQYLTALRAEGPVPVSRHIPGEGAGAGAGEGRGPGDRGGGGGAAGHQRRRPDGTPAGQPRPGPGCQRPGADRAAAEEDIRPQDATAAGEEEDRRQEGPTEGSPRDGFSPRPGRGQERASAVEQVGGVPAGCRAGHRGPLQDEPSRAH
ncbi:non-homologous end joining protein Ku [Streptomyces sp. NBC_01591]|uniref:non-homologous end joining protein Ku n=1 Tax=Streptomyces sp. NBC_01591 TaxID=2975888 RepID=UPI002DD94F65|nr:Ku protein [Streptomyces sp. NBC_01591]